MIPLIKYTTNNPSLSMCDVIKNYINYIIFRAPNRNLTLCYYRLVDNKRQTFSHIFLLLNLSNDRRYVRILIINHY